jgi:hypothetical protein
MKKLYRGSVKVTTYFLTDKEHILESEALKYLAEDVEGSGFTGGTDLEVCQVGNLNMVPEDWKGSIPWGSDNTYQTITGYFQELNNVSCDGKIVMIDGKQYKLTEVK